MILDIHLEYSDDNGERLEKIAGLGKPFSVSVVPVLFNSNETAFKEGIYPKDYSYPERIAGLLKELAKEKNVSFGQQGFSHYCHSCFEQKNKRDPWHENKCLYEKEKSAEEQAEFMEKGKRVIENKLGVSPVIYCPPNHQFDKNTKIAAEKLGYKFFAIKGIINLPPYQDRNLLLLPERKLRQDGEIFYTHYNQMKDNFEEYLEMVNSSISLSEVCFFKKAKNISWMNDHLVTASKKIRDFAKR